MKLLSIENKIISIRGQQVILDSDVAELYGVETKHINQAVRNNPDKFPDDYIIALTTDEFEILRSKILTAKLNKSRIPAKVFTEKGLYMLATILKSPVATETTIAIIETFAKVRELSRTIGRISEHHGDAKRQKSLMQRGGDLISDILDDSFQTIGTETTIEFNLSVLKVKHTVKKESSKK